MFLNKYILSYNDVIYRLDKLCKNYSNIIIKKEPIGYTSFGFPIDYYKIGNGSKDVVLIAATHGCELVTITFLLEFVYTIIKKNDKYSKYLNKYSFHIIPILNPEGYIISSSNVLNNIKNMDLISLQNYCKKYVELYEQDDLNAEKELKCEKLYKNLMTISSEFIAYSNLRYNVDKILAECKLDNRVLPIWSSNGMGIDINANSIHEFENMKNLKNTSKYGRLRYNDIPVNIPSPHGYPGDNIFDKKCPENIALYNFINKIYNNRNLKLFISYHSTGAEIYGYPQIKLTTNNQFNTILNGLNYYSELTNYTPINENIKYGVMDYYRISLENTVTLTVELSKINGNPIGPFSNIQSLNKEFTNNINSIFYTLDCISKK
ncbi:MAG: M14 family zinc carboxypeptidase [Clostridia bacterium]|nr:M14 family zinc carboxypeptidase [Clostridia bacterium]MDD4386138.1 M14 family zinc carboxypeptidase [Clostridia bacterium]